ALDALTLSLEIAKGHGASKSLIEALEQAIQNLNHGEPLSSLFRNVSTPIPSSISLALECGEQTGQLAPLATRHLQHWQAVSKASKDLQKSLIYPFAVLVASVFCWWLLDVSTASFRQELPQAKASPWTLADFLLALGAGTLLIGLPTVIKDRRLLKTRAAEQPSLKGMSPSKAWYVAHFFFSIEQELLAGYDLLYCLRHRHLRIQKGFIGQKHMHTQLNLLCARLHKAVKEGQGFSEAMQQAQAPGFMVRQAKVSELTGELSNTFAMARRLFEMEAVKRQKKIQNLLAPLTLLVATLTLLVAYQTSVAPIYSNLTVFQ
ncbi:MAG: type II secretion system F family protein, partial [Limnobacter sp.]|nr:type II secretion system F family protein [Limnobacter sp.]